MESMIISVCCFVFLIIITFVFFTKPKISKLENKVFSWLLALNIVGLILQFLSYMLVNSIDGFYNTVYYILILRMIFCYYVLWEIFFVYYIAIISFSLNEKKDNNKKPITILFLIGLFIALQTLVLPVNVTELNGLYYPTGPAMIFLVIGVLYGMIIIFYCIIKNIKHIIDIRYLPLLFYIIFGSIAIIWQMSNPKLLLITPIESLVLFLMYFTIENPDMKLLEEVHKAKVISDNANEEKTMFLYNITNEIRGITKDINYEADNILNETDNKKVDLNIVNDSAREIKGSTAKFTTMTNEILDISQVDASNIKIYNEKYSIKLILKELITKYKETCKKSGIEFRTSIASDIPEILYGDSVGLKNVMISLLDNSIKYTKKGYIELNVNVIKKQDIARLLITIEDSGIGIKSSEIDNIFNKNKEELKRNNLKNNLFTARKIITLMGGTLIATSTYGKGTTMKIVLDQKIEVIDNKYDKVYDKKKILLIEDSDTTYKLITKMLKNTNIIIDRVVLGSEGLDKIRNKEKYDLILVEEELKPLNGYDIIKKLKLIKNFNTKVVLLTKNPNIEYSYLYKDEGFSDYLIKPINRLLLLNIINKY